MSLSILVDAAIVVIYFAGIIWIGLYLGRRENTLSDFALGGRSMPWWAVMASIIAAETSAATFLGTPSEGFKSQSIAYSQLVIGLILGRIFVGLVFLDRYYRYQVYTVYDFLSIRFGPLSKNYVSALFLMMRTLASGTRLFVPSLVMVLAWNALARQQTSVLTQAGPTLQSYVVAIVALTILTCIYTSFGGIKAVVWTDVAQASLMLTSVFIAIITLLYHIGNDSWNLMNGIREISHRVPQMNTHEGYFILGWEPARLQAWEQARHVTRMSSWEYIRLILGSDYTLFSALIGSTVGSIAAFGTDQDMVQRMLTAQTASKSRKSLITASFMDIPIATGFTLIGVLLSGYYQINPTFKPAATADVFASYILNVMPMGIRGLVLAGVFATAMGSLSAALNSLATSATNDWYIPYFAPYLTRGKSEANHVLAARIFTVVFAILMIAVAVVFAYVKVTSPQMRIIPVVLGIAGLFLGPMLGLFLLGMLTRTRGSDVGNLLAVTTGLIGILFISGQYVVFLNLMTGANRAAPAWLPAIAWPWFATFGAAITFGIAVLFRTNQDRLDAISKLSQDDR
jgi:SSS family solute:Na+ symporter